MLRPDIEKGRRFIEADPPPGQVLCCGVTGSHFYGFPSPDSDLDLKGVHLAPTASVLGLSNPPETFDRLSIFEGLECDYTSHEARKALSLLLRGNGNMLERFLSPFQLYETSALHELRQLAQGTISKLYFGHYRGFFEGMCREHQRNAEPRAKTMLYAYRVALTGIHLLRTGELVGDVTELAPLYGFGEVSALARLKTEGAEQLVLSPEDDSRFRVRWSELEAALQGAFEVSTLPAEPMNAAGCDEWLVRMRRASS